MSLSVHDVAAYILKKQGEMSAMKLQKLVYYSQAWSLARLGGLEALMRLGASILRHRGKKVGTTGFCQFEGFAGAWIFGGACSGRLS